ncbi:UBX domain-containing protein 4 isoform X1 [Euwallacea similis]|uniref:UBX domain-containing protein 4 isoform X1 n=1 Tax=Euwallacea similis TaxID=1736056 RepID=UPI00344F1B44
MRWYDGGIAEAVVASKSKGAIFVVYIEGKDEKSQSISSIIESNEVSYNLGSNHFVAIKVEAGSVPHQQFIEFYKDTPVPSLYFIGKNGSPLKVITETPNAATLNKELQDILAMAGMNPLQDPIENAASVSANLINTERTEPANIVCENGVCTIKKSPEPSQPSTSSTEDGEGGLSAAEKLERAKKLLEAKKLAKEREEKENEKLKELERRKTGQEVQKMKKMQEDQELRQAVEEREKEKRLEREARERVLTQIAQDKAERAAKFQPVASSTPTGRENTQASGPSTNKQASNTARLQFKMPDGTSKTEDFPSSDKLISVVNYVKTNFNLASNKFTLSTTFPRRQFTESDHTRTLAELQLTPNAVVLVLPLTQGGTVSTNQGPGGIVGFIWGLLTPLMGIFNFIKVFLGIGNVEQTNGNNQPSTSGGYSSGGSGSNSVVHVRSKYDLENRLKSANSRLVLIDFFATWCGPCRMIAPELERMAKEFPNVVFLKVDVDESGDISREYGITAMPTFVFLKNRREVSRVQGADGSRLRSTIQRYK